MQMQKKVGGGVPFARKAPYEYDKVQYDADLKDGDVVTILDEGVVEPNNYGGNSKYFKIKTRNGEKKISLNQRSENVLVDSFGNDSKTWVGKDVNVILQKTVIGGKKCIVAYLVTEGWKLDDYGELTKLGQQKEESVEYPEEEIDPEDIPF